jgi:hypothetical protein
MVDYEKIFRRLSESKIRYLIAGGFAVNFHQVQRATVDLDLIVWLDKKNILSFINLMSELGLLPRVPVSPLDFAEETKRQEWIDQKGMLVFTFYNPSNPFEIVDVFAKEPFPFERMWKDRTEVKAFGVLLPVVSKKDLIAMKENTGRDRDVFDVEQLKKIPSK